MFTGGATEPNDLMIRSYQDLHLSLDRSLTSEYGKSPQARWKLLCWRETRRSRCLDRSLVRSSSETSDAQIHVPTSAGGSGSRVAHSQRIVRWMPSARLTVDFHPSFLSACPHSSSAVEIFAARSCASLIAIRSKAVGSPTIPNAMRSTIPNAMRSRFLRRVSRSATNSLRSFSTCARAARTAFAISVLRPVSL